MSSSRHRVLHTLPLLAQEPLPKRLAHLLSRQPLHRVHTDQPLNHVLRTLRNVLMNVLKLSLSDLLKKVILVLGPKRIIALQHHKQKHPQTPKISVMRNMIPFRHNLRSHVGRSTAKCINRTRRHRLQTKPEIDQLQLLVTVEQNVLSLNVPVDNVTLVKIFNRLSNGLKKLLGLRLSHSVLRLGKEVVVKRVCSSIFLNQEYLASSLDHLNQPSYHRMAQP